MKRITLLIMFLLWPFLSFAGPLTVDSTNVRYFTKGGDIQLLSGSQNWCNMKDQDGTADDYPSTPRCGDTTIVWADYLSSLSANGQNFIRLWTWEVPTSTCGGTDTLYVDPWPWVRTGGTNATDGKPKFDLTTFNQDYFDRLRTRVVAARDLGIYVGVMLFEGYGVLLCNGASSGFPGFPANNVLGEGSTTKADYFTTTNTAMFARQKLYIDKTIDTLNDLDNVIWEIANEADAASTAWQSAMVTYIKNYEAGKAKQHPVWVSNMHVDTSNDNLFSITAADTWSPGTYSDDYDTHPPVNSLGKPIILDTDHLGTTQTSAWFWEAFMRGYNLQYLDAYGYDDTVGNPRFYPSEAEQNLIRPQLGYIKALANRSDLRSMTPSTTISSTEFALVNAGHEYIAYQDDTGAFTVNMVASSGPFSVDWVETTTGVITAGSDIYAGSTAQSFTAPVAQRILHLKAKNNMFGRPIKKLWGTEVSKIWGATLSGRCEGYLICEGAEGTGTPTGWTDTAGSGTINWDYTTNNLDLAQSLFLDAPASGTTMTSTPAFSGLGTTHFYTKFRVVTAPTSGGTGIVGFETAGHTWVAGIEYYPASGGIKADIGGTLSGACTISTGVTYDLWATYTKGQDTATMYLYLSTDGVKGSSCANVTGNGGTNDVVNVAFYAQTGAEVVIDRVRIRGTPIGDKP